MPRGSHLAGNTEQNKTHEIGKMNIIKMCAAESRYHRRKETE